MQLVTLDLPLRVSPAVRRQPPDVLALLSIVGFLFAYVATEVLPVPRPLYVPADGRFILATHAPHSMGYFGLWMMGLLSASLFTLVGSLVPIRRRGRTILAALAASSVIGALTFFLVTG
jgi:hypothetical protein